MCKIEYKRAGNLTRVESGALWELRKGELTHFRQTDNTLDEKHFKTLLMGLANSSLLYTTRKYFKAVKFLHAASSPKRLDTATISVSQLVSRICKTNTNTFFSQ